MNVNGVTSQSVSSYTHAAGTAAPQNTSAAPAVAAGSAAGSSGSSTSGQGQGVIYEPSKESQNTSAKKTYTQNTDLVNKLNAEVEARTSQLRSLVEKMISKQANAYGNANDIWSILRSGNFTVDAETKAQAQADIAEDGYWGVKQTSERILDFATALTGGDPSKLEKMRDAFQKGFKQAEKTWGDALPEISQKTYDAVMKGFDKLAEEAGITFSS